jgi:hypothetical protein
VPQGTARERKKNQRPLQPPYCHCQLQPVFPSNHVKLFNGLMDRSSPKKGPFEPFSGSPSYA